MEEIISSILQAEKKAEEIIKNASDTAKNIIIYAENSADEIREKAVSDFKTRRKEVLKQAEEEAERLYSEKIAEGEKKAKELSSSVKNKIDDTAEKILKEIVG